MAIDPNPAVDDDGASTATTAAPSTALVPARTDARVAADTTTTTDDSPTVAVAPAGPIKKMLDDPNVPGSLMTGAQKDLAAVQAMSAGIRAAQKRVQGVIDKVLNNEEEAIKSRGEAGETQGLDAAKLSQAYPQEQVRIILDKRKAYLNKYNATADWDDDTPYSKLMADVEKLNPHNVPADSPAFATHVDMYTEALKEANDHEKRRQARYKQQAEDTGREAHQMMMPDDLRPQGVPPMNGNWLSQNAVHMKPEDIDKVTKFLKGGAEYSDRFVLDDMMDKALYKTPEDLRTELDANHANHLISNADREQVLHQNKEAQEDVGFKYIKEAMDTKLLGKDDFMVSALNSMRQKVLQTYLADRSAHPEWKDSDRLAHAMELERSNQIFDGNTVMYSLAITPFMQQAGATDRNSVINDPTIITRARELATAENQAGRLNAYQRVVERNSLRAWESYFATVNGNGARKKSIEDATKRKPQ